MRFDDECFLSFGLGTHGKTRYYRPLSIDGKLVLYGTISVYSYQMLVH